MIKRGHGGVVAIVALLGCVGVAQAADAQRGKIVGSVTDTLNRRRLVGAQIAIEGIERTFVTDSSGRFSVDSLPPGQYRLTFRHPVLDTLGLRSSVVLVTVTAGTPVRAALGVPSGRSFMRLCPAPPTPRSRAAVFGVVRHAMTDEPLAGVDIRLSWDDVVVDQQLGVRRKVQVRNAVTDATGRYLVCDLPTDVSVSVLGSHDGFLVALGETALRTEEAIPLHLSLAPEGVEATASVTGKVIDSERQPLADADIWIVTGQGGEGAVVRSDASGNFALSGLRPGTGMVAVRRIGSAPMRRTVSLAAGRSTPIVFTLTRQIATLPEIKVEGKASRAEQAGFLERQTQGFGRFYDQVGLERFAAVTAGDVFRQLPTIRIERGMSGTMLRNHSLGRNATGQACAMVLLVDGMQTPPDAIFSMMKEELEGIEVYDRQDRVPIEYQSPSTSCGAVLVWTKR